MRVALVTCETLPEPDPDQQPLLEALVARGLNAQLLPWDRPGADPGDFDLCVLRSTWNYFERPHAFLAWIERAARVSRLCNDASVVRWNVHKRYLLTLAADGIPVIPTVLVEQGAEFNLGGALVDRGWADIVIKPAVSAGSFQTRRFSGASGEAVAFLAAMAAKRDVLVQEYMPTVESGGERALVHVDGEFTHAVHKQPRFAGEEESVSEALPLQPDELALAARVWACARGHVGATDPWLYGRVDVFRDDAGQLCLSELELVEPSLFLVQSPEALERFADAIDREVRVSVTG